MAGGRLVASAIVGLAIALSSCGSSSPTSPTPTPTPGPGDPLTNNQAAIARATSVADTQGPLVPQEVLLGTYAALDPEAHNFLGPPPPVLPGATEVWRVTLLGPHGSETIVLSMNGDLIGAVTQGT